MEVLLISFMLLVLPSLPLEKDFGGIVVVLGALAILTAYFLVYGEELPTDGRFNWMVMTLAIGSGISLGLMMLLLIRGY